MRASRSPLLSSRCWLRAAISPSPVEETARPTTLREERSPENVEEPMTARTSEKLRGDRCNGERTHPAGGSSELDGRVPTHAKEDEDEWYPTDHGRGQNRDPNTVPAPRCRIRDDLRTGRRWSHHRSLIVRPVSSSRIYGPRCKPPAKTEAYKWRRESNPQCAESNPCAFNHLPRHFAFLMRESLGAQSL
jgi:hypothetical protein